MYVTVLYFSLFSSSYNLDSIQFFSGDLVALFEDDDIDELKQERNEVVRGVIFFPTFTFTSLSQKMFITLAWKV